MWGEPATVKRLRVAAGRRRRMEEWVALQTEWRSHLALLQGYTFQMVTFGFPIAAGALAKASTSRACDLRAISRTRCNELHEAHCLFIKGRMLGHWQTAGANVNTYSYNHDAPDARIQAHHASLIINGPGAWANWPSWLSTARSGMRDRGLPKLGFGSSY